MPECMDYAFKRGFKPDLERIREVLAGEFPAEICQEEEKLCLCYGALKSLCVWIEGKRLYVTTDPATGAADDLILDTNKRYRDFLEKATGYTAKQRQQMAKKEASGGDA
jgi:hypothetical protein